MANTAESNVSCGASASEDDAYSYMPDESRETRDFDPLLNEEGEHSQNSCPDLLHFVAKLG